MATSDTFLLTGTYSQANQSQSSITFEVYGLKAGAGPSAILASGADSNYVDFGTKTVRLEHGVGVFSFTEKASHDSSNPFTGFVLQDKATHSTYFVASNSTATDTAAGTLRVSELTVGGNSFWAGIVSHWF